MDLLMVNEKAVRERIEAFKLASASERTLMRKFEDLDLDFRVATRNGDHEAVEKLKTIKAAAASEWYAAHREFKATVPTLCEVLGIDPADLKRAL